MSQLNRESLVHLTKLCRINCTEEELSQLLHDLENVLSYVGQLQEINTENIPSCDQVLEEIHNVMREDVAGPSLPRDLFLENAPAHIGGMIRVPPVLKQA